MDKGAVDITDERDFLGRAGREDHPVGLEALVLAAPEHPLDAPRFVDQHAPQPEAGWAALAISPARSAGTARQTPWPKLAAIFAGHRALDALDDGRDRAAVVFELLGAVLHGNAGAPADVFVVGALVGVLEPAPAADVIDQDGLEIGVPALDILDQLLERVAARRSKPALALIGIGPDDLDPAAAAYCRIASAWFSVEYC